MNPYTLTFDEFSRLRPWRFVKVRDVDALNRRVAEEVAENLQEAEEKDAKLVVICPVGPLNYAYWADLMNDRQTSGTRLITVNMDEYVDEGGRLIDESHPLSFRRFMNENLFGRLKGRARVPNANIHFPSPQSPSKMTELIESSEGADLCYGGMGLTGHFAFNDPPEPGDPVDDNAVRNSRTRSLTISRESRAQMCMGGTDGNWEIIPARAVTLGMYELLMSKKIHLTFMRSWHAGVLRRALFGPVNGQCPGSFVQEHPNVEVTLTGLAAALPLIRAEQRTESWTNNRIQH